MPAKKNIVVLMADQLTAFALGCYRHPVVKSPHIDQLAAEGVVFDAAYSSSPLCTPARAGMMTGRFGSRTGGYDNSSYLPSTTPTFAHYLRLMGYRTCLAGKMHFVGPDQLHGFEERYLPDVYPCDLGWIPNWDQPDDRIDEWYHNMSSVVQAGVAEVTNQLSYDDAVGYQALRAIHNHARGSDERPLCLVVSFIHPHDPYATRQKYWDLYDDQSIDMPRVPMPENPDPHSARLAKVIAQDAVDVDEAMIRRARRAYYGNVSYVDEWVGKIRAALSSCGLLDQSTLLLTSDHGDMLGERGLWYKMSFFEWSNRVPLIVWQPETCAPKRVASPASLVDILPTLVDVACEQTGERAPGWIDPPDGRSLWGLCRGDLNDDNGVAMSEYMAEGTGAPMLMIRRGQYKYNYCATDPEQLFDLVADPDELHNLIDSDAHRTQLEAFRKMRAAHWDDDLLRQQVIQDQRRRRLLSKALNIGRFTSWDYQVPSDIGSDLHTHANVDLTEFDNLSRYPRAQPFKPKWR